MLPRRSRENSTASLAPSSRPLESSPSLPVAAAQRTLAAIMPNQIALSKSLSPFPRFDLTLSWKKIIVIAYGNYGSRMPKERNKS